MGKWVKKKLGDYVVLQGGFAFQSKDFVEDGVPLIRIGDITKEGLCDENAVKLPVNFLDECKEFALNEYDTIIAMSGATTGKCTIVSKKNLPALLNQRVGRFKIKNSSIDKLYLYYIVSSYYYQQKLLLDAIGGAQPNVSPRQIEKVICAFPILLDGSPDFSEQRRIASILSSADKVIDSTQKLIAKYKQIKQGMMEDLLKPKEGWKKVKLGEVGEINPPNKESIPERFVYVDLESVVAGQLLFENIIVKKGAPSRAQRITYENDVLYQTVRPYQKNNYIHKKAGNYVASTGYALIRCNVNYSSDFVYYVLHTYKFESNVLGLCTGTSYPAIAPNNLKKIEIFVPDLSEQRRIASILSSIDKKIESEEKVLYKYKNIKKGLMEKLLKEEEV